MKGTILDFNEEKQAGLILAEDGNRYTFTLAQWKERNKAPHKGIDIDFIAQHTEATQIYEIILKKKSIPLPHISVPYNLSLSYKKILNKLSSDDELSFIAAVKICLEKFFNIRDRASEQEFWFFYLFYSIFSSVAMIIIALFGFILSFFSYNIAIIFDGILCAVTVLCLLILLIPALTVTIRRLHDSGRSGLWILMIFNPILGIILLYVMLAQPTQPKPNKYGLPPSL